MDRDLDKKTYIEEEAFMIEHSGEIPEVALHSSLYYLGEDPEGPGLHLDADDVLPLKQAVVKRYRVIILRDLDPENRDKRMYRGLARCAVNWQRLLQFCTRENLACQTIKLETAGALQKFLANEVADVKDNGRRSSVNCSAGELESLVVSLELSGNELPEGWQEVCPAGCNDF
jgi:hypothetical protein